MSSRGDSQDNRHSQPKNNDSWLSLEIYIKANNPNLLTGLDRWLELGLISQTQVKTICRYKLSCTLPETKVVTNTPKVKTTASKVTANELVKITDRPNIINHIWQGFLDELSIRWLLFLGIFLVVVSSGVLAASQWQNFSRFGQYLVLLVYTLGFWGIGFWSSKQENLQLTSQTVKAIALLLVPINCWSISDLGLGNNILEWITLIVALIILTTIVCLLSRFKQKSNYKLFISLFLLLSYLHLIWQFIPILWMAIYGGIAVIGLSHYWFLLPKKKYPLFNLLFLLSAWSLLLARVLLTKENLITHCGLAIAIFGWILATIYLTRERRVQTISLNRQIARQLTNTFLSKVVQTISLILFVVTWLVSVLGGIFNSPWFFWQTVGISALAIHLFSQRLTLYWRKRDLTAIFFIGLQTLYVSKELIPPQLRNNALDLAVTISKTEYLPESVFGVTLFPYIILFVAIAAWLDRRQKPELARYAEGLTLLLGLVLTYLSWFNPTWRSLNLLFSTLTLGYVACTPHRPIRILLVYFTHLLGLVTVVNAIATISPNLSQSLWGSILVLLMVLEWIVYSHQTKQQRNISQPKLFNVASTNMVRIDRDTPRQHNFKSILVQSCWYAGLLLAAISYVCFASQIADPDSSTPDIFVWGSIWLIVPGMLTWVAKYTHKIQQRRIATTFSCIALIVAQILLLGQPVTRSIGLIVAIGLMFVNAFHLRRTWVTAIHIGFGLISIASLLYPWVNNLNNWHWLSIGAVTILGLDRFRQYLQRSLDTPKFDYISQRTAHGILGVGRETRNFKLIKKYSQAADYWAIALLIIELAIVSIIYFNLLNISISGLYFQYLLTTGLLTGTIVWRYHEQQQPNNLVLYTLVWLVALFAAALAMLLGRSGLILATTNISLGFISTIAIGWLIQTTSAWARLNLSYIPLIYAVLGIFWRFPYFNSYTGLITLGAAAIFIDTPQQHRQVNLITNYLGFIGVSLGIYELVIYQMQQSSGGSAADGITILALVAAAIAFTYRLGAWWCGKRHTTIFNLSLTRVVLVAHIHWAIGSILKIIAASIAIETITPRLTPISLATSFFLGVYAVIQGKDGDLESSDKTHDWWVYVGLVEIAATLVYSRLIISQLSLFDPWRVIFTCAIALLIYQIPWQNFGWRVTPWQRAAVITPALMSLVTAENISYLSLLATAAFYVRIAFWQKNLRWSYLSLGFINWGIIRLVWQFNTEFIWLAGIVSLSILYIAQFDPYFQSKRQQRHWMRLIGCTVICVVALFYQDPGIIPGIISFSLIFLGLGLRIRAFLFSGTITLILTVIYQLMTLVIAYSFLKWIVGLLAGILFIIVAAGFENTRVAKQWYQAHRLKSKLQSYNQKLQNWQ
ncbi:MAG: hypothetical protein QNJ72_27085 [Pleurocapsa sp. MO_226.B13]|nr:hypothetical protein [Pleurocapsa sp. MO_226.B13]